MGYDQPEAYGRLDRRNFLKLSALALTALEGAQPVGGADSMASPHEKPIPVIDSGQPQLRLVSWRDAGEVQQSAIALVQRHLKERAGVSLPVYWAERSRLPGSAAGVPDGMLLMGTLAQIRAVRSFRRWADEIRDKIGPEGFALEPAPGRSPAVAVIGTDENGLLYGAGHWLRSVKFTGQDAITEVLRMYDTPETPIRGHLLANHLWSPQYDNWDEACWDQYLSDLALWGVNTVLTTPYHPGEWAACLPFSDPPVFRNEAVRQAWEFYWRVQQAIPTLARKYGMRFGVWIPPNDIPVDEARPQTEGGRCDNVCPSQPDMRALILHHREAVFQALNPLDLVIIPASDCGGCSCSACAPWAKTYLALAEEIARSLHRCHPRAWMGISNQNLSQDENTWLYEYLQTRRPSWLKFVIHGPGSPDLKHMRQAIPDEYDLFVYPDTTHLAASPGYLVEDIKTDPFIWRAYQQAHLEATPFARPKALGSVYPAYRASSQGSFPYSEGAHDDLNKVVWSQLDWNPKAHVPDIVQAYCQFYFAGQASLAEVYDALERALTLNPESNLEIEPTLARMEAAKAGLPGWAVSGWRWKMLEARVFLDRFLQLHQGMDRQVEEALRACLEMEHPEVAVRDVATRIRDSGPRPVLDDLRLDLGAMFPYFGSAEAVRQERKAYGERPLSPLQSSLDAWSADLKEMEHLDHRIQALSRELRQAVGLELRAAWVIRGAKTSYDTRLEDLEALACGPEPKLLRQAIARTLAPEVPDPGGTYDDLGHPEKQPHLRAGRRWEDAFGDVFLRERLASERRAVSPWEEALILVYEGLRSDIAYEIRVTYVQSRHETRKQRLTAESAQGTVEIHAPLLLPTRPQLYTYILPPGVIAGGRLELRFTRVEGYPHNAVASEVWLSPREPDIGPAVLEGTQAPDP